MDRKRWMFVMVTLLLAAGFAFAADKAPEAAAISLTAMFAGAAWWKGALSGIGRGVYGFFTSTQEGKQFDVQKLVTAAIAGAIAGIVAEKMGLSFENAGAYIASFGLTEIIQKGVSYVWTKWAGNLVGEAVTKSMERSASRAVSRNLKK